MADPGVLSLLSIAFAIAGAGVVLWGLLSGRIRPRGYRGAAVLLALGFSFFAVARDALGGPESAVELVVAMGIVFVWGEFTVPTPRVPKIASSRSVR